jgi:hypothetical protein
MKADGERSSVNPPEAEATKELRFPVFNDYWEALRQGQPSDVEDWIDKHPEGKDGLGDFRLLAKLHAACQVLREDSVLHKAEMDNFADANEESYQPLLQPGARLGECRITGLLGCGGMSEVYLAEHEVLGCQVAVKVLQSRLGNDVEAVRRFRQSVQILARLRPHPHIAAALHASDHEGCLYLTMEYVDGSDLRAFVRQSGPLSVAQACDYIRQAALGLEYAHQHGIVHRDIKPSNLMLTQDGRIKILDLGLARRTGPALLDADASQTGAGVVIGTLDYIAPEQGEDAGQADSRSDLYSLGCTFYYLLTGRAPFDRHSPLKKLLAHIQEDPEPIQQVRPDVPPAVATVVHRLLAKRPEDRYSSAGALIEALDAALGSTKTNVSERASRPRATHSWQWWRPALAAGFVLSVLGIGWLLAMGLPAWGPKDCQPELASGHALAVAMEVKAYRGKPAAFIGKLGSTCYTTQLNDAVRVQIQFSEPAYCYLLAFNPNGTEQLCYPDDPTTVPSKSLPVLFPAEANKIFYFTDGVGVQVMALLASRQPLPCYAEWKSGAKVAPWKGGVANGVWRFDGQQFEPLGTQRGTVQDIAGLPASFAELCSFLKSRPGVEVIDVLAFPVELAAEPNTTP